MAEQGWTGNGAWLIERIRALLRRLIPASLLRFFEGFWAVPLALTLGGLGLAAAIQLVDQAIVQRWFGIVDPRIDVEGARAALTVVAGGVITIASLVFSLTFVALSITAQQLSPRILDYVLREQAMQTLLGLTLATFLFAAISLWIGDARGPITLLVAAPIALTLAAVTLAMVVIFAHRMTQVMRAEDMVSRLGDQYTAAVRRSLEAPSGCIVPEDPEAEAKLAATLAEAVTIPATGTGYLGTVDYAGLCAWAEADTLLIEILLPENAFVLTGQPVARIAGLHDGQDEAARRVTGYLCLSDHREPGVTADYEAASLCEAALRALSPGINDPATAMACANRLFQGLVIMVDAALPSRALAPPDGFARVLQARYGLPEFVRDTVLPIAEAARDRAPRHHLTSLSERLRARVTRPADIAALDELAAALRG